MTPDLITTDELRAMFGDTMPMDAVRILFPERFEGSAEDTRPVSAVRADLVACAEQYRKVFKQLRWEKQGCRSWQAYAGKHSLGHVMAFSDGSGVDWRISAVTFSQYLPPVAGECATMAEAKREFEAAWRRWLNERGLAEVDSAR